MALPGEKFNLYAYPATGADLTGEPGASPLPDGGVRFQYAARGPREELRARLLERKVLCSTRPIAPERRELWSGFLRGERGASAFGFWRLVFGPLWYLKKRLGSKLFLLLAPALAFSGLARLAGIEARGVIVSVRVDSLIVPLGLDLTLLAFLCLWAGFFGEFDLYLQAILREPLWPALRPPEVRAAAYAAWLLCIAFYVVAAATFTDSLKFNVAAPSSGAPAALTFDCEVPLWRALASPAARHGCAAAVVTQNAGTDPLLQGALGAALIGSSRELAAGADPRAPYEASAGAELLRRSVGSGNPEAVRRYGPVLAKLVGVAAPTR